MSKKFYITTTLPYVNSDPHIGFAAEIIKADVIARYRRSQGDEVFFNTGTDEHGLKIYRKAIERGLTPQAYCDEYAAKFESLKTDLNLSIDNFIRTTDPAHIAAAQELWRRCEAKGDIYKKYYETKYCVGCEVEKTDSELVNGCCELHPNQPLEIIAEENYFFRFSKYQEQLLKLYEKNTDFVVPDFRLKDIKQFVAGGLQDFSISRLQEKMPWGIPVPGDETQNMYVWFDALTNYISAIGWPQEDSFKAWWPAVQVCGKDNLRFQTAMWQAMLMSGGIEPSKQVLVFGFITANGHKMSKSLGNVVNPYDLVQKYGIDATRYYLLAESSPFADCDFSEDKMLKRYNADLANGLGNLVARVSNLLEKNQIAINIKANSDAVLLTGYQEKMDHYLFNEALALIWKKLKSCDEFLTAKEPWKMKDVVEIKKILEPASQDILNAAILLQPFMPASAQKIITQFSTPQVIKTEGLFPRIKSETPNP